MFAYATWSSDVSTVPDMLAGQAWGTGVAA